MKSKLLFIAALSAFTFSLNACPKPSDTTLTHQYETGALQWQVVRKEVDPNTLIHQAILENAPEVISFLLSHGVKVDYPDENGMSPLTIAILNKSTDAVRVLLANGANPNPAVKWNNMTLLELALAMRDPASANQLVQYGADLTFKNRNGKGILSMVIQISGPSSAAEEKKGWVTVAKNMIQLGADIQSYENNNDPLFEAIFTIHFGADISLLELLVSKGANLNAVRKNGAYDCDTPLLRAIDLCNLKLVKYFVESGADVNQSIKLGANNYRTPLTLAISKNVPEIVQYLIQHGARG